MAKFKKLALLCTALCATLSLTAGCGLIGGNTSSSESESPVESSSALPEESSEAVSSEDISSDTTIESSIEESSSESSVEESSSESSIEESSSESSVEESSSESSSEESSDSTGGGEESSVHFELIDNGEIEVNNYRTAPMTFNLEAGRYTINTTNASAAFGRYESATYNTYSFELAEAGEITIYAYIFSWDYSADEPLMVDYFLYKVEPVVLETSGTIEVLANADVTMSFVAPTTGRFKVSVEGSDLNFGSSRETEVYNSDWTEVIGTDIVYDYEMKSSYIVEATEGDVIEFFFKIDSAYESFEFTYTIAEVPVVALVLGEQEATLNPNEDTKFTFTAEASGEYNFLFKNAAEVEAIDPYAPEACLMFGVYNAEYDYIAYNYSTNSTYAIEAGTTLELYAKFYSSDAIDAITDTIVIKYLEPSLIEGDNTVDTNAEGVEYLFRATSDNYHNFSSSDALLSFDNGATWVESYELYLLMNEEVRFLVKSETAETATVAINTSVYAMNIFLDEESVTNMTADKNYSVTLVGATYYGEYFINVPENVTITIEGEVYVSGTKFTYYYQEITAIASVGGEYTFYMNEYQYPALTLGENSIALDADVTVQYQYEVTEIGTYTFVIEGANVYSAILSPKSYGTFVKTPDELSAAGTLTIDMVANDMLYLNLTSSAAETVKVTVSHALNEAGELALGDMTISLAADEVKYYAVTLEGDYTFSWDNMGYNILLIANGSSNYDAFDTTFDGTKAYVVLQNTDTENAYEFTVSITKALVKFSSTDGMPTYIELAEGESVILETPIDYYGNTITGTLQITWDETVTNLSVTYYGAPLANGDTFEVYSWQPEQLVITTTDGTAFAGRILIATYVAPVEPLVVGENAVYVTAYPGYVVTSFSGEAGTYTISVEGGSTVYVENGEPGYDEMTSFTLENDGDSIDIGVVLSGWSDADVYVTITKN